MEAELSATESRLLLRPAEAAEVLSISRSTLYSLLGRGEIESVRVGGCRCIPVKALEVYIDRLRAGRPDPNADSRPGAS